MAQKATLANDDTSKLTAESLALDLNDNYLTYNDTRRRPPVREFRLTLSKVDHDYFKDLLNGNNPNVKAVSHKRLRFAWKYIYEELIFPILHNKELSTVEQLDALQALKDNILENSVVIHIVCDNLDEAYQLFEVLNDRGKELAIGDYLRSTTLELLGDNFEFQELVSECWDEILAKSNAEQYIRAYLTSHIATLKRSNVHRQFQKKFFLTDNLQEIVVRDRVVNLRSLYDIYEYLVEGEYPYSKSQVNNWEKNRLSLIIKQLDHRLCIPFLLALYECGTESDFIEAVKSIEKIVFRYITVAGLRANRLSEIYKKYILSMRSFNSFDLALFQKDLSELTKNHCNDEIFEKAIDNLVYKPNTSMRKK